MDPRHLPTGAGAAGSSIEQYRQLKSELGLTHDPVLGLFERYCARARGALDSMEWSWKFQGEQALANRVFWLGAGGCRVETGGHLNWLIGELGITPAALVGASEWGEILRVHMERALVSYAGPNPWMGRPAAIKIYLTLEGCNDAVYRGLIRPLSPELPEHCPPGSVRPLICYAAYDDGGVASRAYFLYHAQEFENPAVADYFTRLAGRRAVEVARGHPSAGFAFKGDTTNMLGLSLRPTGIGAADHPAWWSSPVLGPLLYAGGRNPALRERLHRVSWVTVPLSDEALRFPFAMPEMNVYVRLG
jgi:hypothetical protein